MTVRFSLKLFTRCFNMVLALALVSKFQTFTARMHHATSLKIPRHYWPGILLVRRMLCFDIFPKSGYFLGKEIMFMVSTLNNSMSMSSGKNQLLYFDRILIIFIFLSSHLPFQSGIMNLNRHYHFQPSTVDGFLAM